MNVNELMRSRRQELGKTQKDVADAVGVSEATVSRWESGDIKNISRKNIAKLSTVLDLPVAVLMDWEEYNVEKHERDQVVRSLSDLASVSDLEHLRIVYDLLKRLENK